MTRSRPQESRPAPRLAVDATRLVHIGRILTQPPSKAEPAWSHGWAGAAVDHWVRASGLPPYYFERCGDEEIARHLRFAVNAWAQVGAPLFAETRQGEHVVLLADGMNLTRAEERLETLSLPGERVWNWSSYVIHSPAGVRAHLIIAESSPDLATEQGPVATPWVSAGGPSAMRGRYMAMRTAVLAKEGFVVQDGGVDAHGEHRILVGFPRHALRHFLANVTRSLGRLSVVPTRKYAVAFGGARPVYVHSIYSKSPFPKNLAADLQSVALYPSGALSAAVDGKDLTPDLANFFDAAAFFVTQFAHRRDAELEALAPRLSGGGDEILRRLARRVDQDHFTPEAVVSAFLEHRELMKEIYDFFSTRILQTHVPLPRGKKGATPGPNPAVNIPSSLSHSHLSSGSHSKEDTLREKTLALIQSRVSREEERLILSFALRFAESVTTTNFFEAEKSALAFMLDPALLSDAHGERPHSVILLSSKDFRGFHVRFAEVARGGVRLITSRDEDRLSANTRGLYEECRNLAATQHRKNKDLPEGGAKGALVLRTPGAPADAAVAAFKKYVGGLLDLLTGSCRGPGRAPEMIFLGPDEGTAGLMDWAARRAEERGLRHAHAFTTGKSSSLGGISHHDFGITTAGVRTWARELYLKMGVREQDVTKVQTGGPDGDLGGNEILQGREKTLAVVDGSGVLYDPKGLDRARLTALAKKRVPVAAWKGALSREGFLIRTEDRNLRLPDGAVVADGAVFRNGFHLHPRFTADVFVPCGGRPASIGPLEAEGLFDASGKPRWKWVVEGANLFITPEGRLALERRGVLLFKDASVNKGGVTSSSLEVLCAMGLPAKTWQRNLTGPTAFRKRFIAEVIATIRANAKAEFEAIWSLRDKGPLSIQSDRLSTAFLAILAEVDGSDLARDPRLLPASLAHHLPPLLKPMASKLARALPPDYARALATRTLVRVYLYKYGTDGGRESWREFVEEYLRTR